jgi:hypothetical protein
MLDWRRLVWLSERELAALDIAQVNLACAAGLPGADKIDHDECIRRIDHYARYAGPYIEGRMPAFYKDPVEYDGSPNKFRMACLVRFLWKVQGLRYNPAKVPADAPFFTEDSFIHGALMGEGGTCATLPVVYAAVGRRLGWPLKLVECWRHQFVRWDEPEERFNIEVNDHSLDDPSDDYYRRGKFEVGPEKEKDWCYLVSHTPKMELAGFLAQRGYHLEKGTRLKEAAESFLWANALVPQNRLYAYNAKQLMLKWRRTLEEMAPPNAPRFRVGFPPGRRWPDTIPLDVERHFLLFEANERCLMRPEHQVWWECLRRSQGQERPRHIPDTISVRLPDDLWSSGP